jgi:hypothetical protein
MEIPLDCTQLRLRLLSTGRPTIPPLISYYPMPFPRRWFGGANSCAKRYERTRSIGNELSIYIRPKSEKTTYFEEKKTKG